MSSDHRTSGNQRSRNAGRAGVIVIISLAIGAGVAIGALRSYVASQASASSLARLCGASRAGAPRIPLAIHSTIGPRTVAPGGVRVRYDISIQRGRAMIAARTPRRPVSNASVTMSVATRLPGGVVASFSPRVTQSGQSALSVKAAPATRTGTYQIAVSASGRLSPRARVQSASTCVTLNVVRPPSFKIAGTTAGTLAPGLWRAIELRIRDPQRFSLLVSGLTVRVSAIRAPRATAVHPCTAADFALRQYSGRQPLAIPRSRTLTLSALHVPSADWPQIALSEGPVNQDGCEQATLTLGFTGTARKGKN